MTTSGRCSSMPRLSLEAMQIQMQANQTNIGSGNINVATYVHQAESMLRREDNEAWYKTPVGMIVIGVAINFFSKKFGFL
jgi:Ca2+-dependent lipid-binding protein